MTYHPKSDFMRVMLSAALLPTARIIRRWTRLWWKGVVPGYIGFDATAAKSLHVGQPDPDHDAALAAEMRRQADRADGRRDDQGGRSVVSGG
jgi:hypothetical protein